MTKIVDSTSVCSPAPGPGGTRTTGLRTGGTGGHLTAARDDGVDPTDVRENILLTADANDQESVDNRPSSEQTRIFSLEGRSCLGAPRLRDPEDRWSTHSKDPRPRARTSTGTTASEKGPAGPRKATAKEGEVGTLSALESLLSPGSLAGPHDRRLSLTTSVTGPPSVRCVTGPLSRDRVGRLVRGVGSRDRVTSSRVSTRLECSVTPTGPTPDAVGTLSVWDPSFYTPSETPDDPTEFPVLSPQVRFRVA